MNMMLTEENGVYQFDCTKALWATNEIREQYFNARIHVLKNADFIIETQDELLIVEYKNATIRNAVNPQAFNPTDDKTRDSLARKYYDSLPYLQLRGKNKPKRYIFIIEAANSDSTMRARLRGKIAKELPFVLQSNMATGINLLEEFDVLSIAEWNAHPLYGNYPCLPVAQTNKRGIDSK